MPDIGSVLNLVFDNGGLQIALFAAWYLTFKSMSQSTNQRFETVLSDQRAHWEAKLSQEREERDRQFEVFKELMEQNNLNTGNLASLKSDIGGLSGRVDKLDSRIEDGVQSIHRRLDTIRACKE